MRKLTVLAAITTLLVGLPLRADEKPTEDYQKAEKALNTANNAMRNHVKSIDYPSLEKDAAAFKEAFGVMLAYWQDKKMDDAVKFVRDGLTGVTALETAAKSMNYDGVLAAQNAIAGSNGVAFVGESSLPGVCVGCHLAHRLRLPDGSYAIK